MASDGCCTRLHLQIGESGFQHEIRRDVELNCVLSHYQFIEEMSGSNREPIVSVVKPVGPIELGVAAQQWMKEQQRDLGMAIFIERSKSRHGPPGAIAPKPCTSQIADDAGELGQRQCGCVHL